jgi:anti-sigma-K factor RskA
MNPDNKNSDNKTPNNKTIDRDVLLEYVMGSLTPEREKEVAGYLRQNPQEAAWVRDMFEAVTEVALSQEPAGVPANAESDLLERIRKESELKARAPSLKANPIKAKPRRGGWAWLGLGLGAAFAVILWVSGGQTIFNNYQISRQLSQVCAKALFCQTLRDENNSEIGTLARRSDNTLLVVFKNNPPQGQVYQGWEIAAGTPASLGVYPGRVMEISQSIGQGNTFGVTLEPSGGSPQPTSTPIVVYTLTS